MSRFFDGFARLLGILWITKVIILIYTVKGHRRDGERPNEEAFDWTDLSGLFAETFFDKR